MHFQRSVCYEFLPSVAVLSICKQSVATTSIISPDNIKKKREGRECQKQGEQGKEKKGSTEHSKGNKTGPGKVATTRTEDGHKQTTKTNTTI